MLEDMEEIFACVDLIQGNEYYIQLDYNMSFNHTAFIKLTEKYNGVYKIKKITHNYCDFICSQLRCCTIINEYNIKTRLMCFHNGNDGYKFTVMIGDMYVLCRIYKINKTEYILK